MLVKICGITSASDARLALEAGADWIGLNFVAGPREIEISRAREILAEIDDPRCAVALIRFDKDGSASVDRTVLQELGIGFVQAYRDVTPEIIAELRSDGFGVIHVQHVMGEESLIELQDFLNRCGDGSPDYVLLDAAADGKLGGTGRTMNWDLLATARRDGRMDHWPPVIMAGGLEPGNVGKAIERIDPAGVDVSSGTEATPGKKDPAKTNAFVAAARGSME